MTRLCALLRAIDAVLARRDRDRCPWQPDTGLYVPDGWPEMYLTRRQREM